MKTGLLILLVLTALGLQAQNNPTYHPPDGVMPLIIMEEVPLQDAVKNLARQGQINYIFDPRVTASYKSEPIISKRWEKVTALQTLNDVLSINKLKLATNPATTVSRIVFASDKVRPAVTNQTAKDSTRNIPVLVMDEMPLKDAIWSLARQVPVRIEFDPKLSRRGSGFDGQPMTQMLVTVRWENVTVQQALDAVLETYGLALVDDPKGSDIKTVTKAKSSTGR